MDKEKQSWEVDSYQEGNWTVSVRRNLENDRMDEGDLPDPIFTTKGMGKSPEDQQVFLDDRLVAEVRGANPSTRTVIPMRELSEEEEAKFQQFLDQRAKSR